MFRAECYRGDIMISPLATSVARADFHVRESPEDA